MHFLPFFLPFLSPKHYAVHPILTKFMLSSSNKWITFHVAKRKSGTKFIPQMREVKFKETGTDQELTQKEMRTWTQVYWACWLYVFYLICAVCSAWLYVCCVCAMYELCICYMCVSWCVCVVPICVYIIYCCVYCVYIMVVVCVCVCIWVWWVCVSNFPPQFHTF